MIIITYCMGGTNFHFAFDADVPCDGETNQTNVCNTEQNPAYITSKYSGQGIEFKITQD